LAKFFQQKLPDGYQACPDRAHYQHGRGTPSKVLMHKFPYSFVLQFQFDFHFDMPCKTCQEDTMQIVQPGVQSIMSWLQHC
jgi:hypothetical protein